MVWFPDDEDIEELFDYLMKYPFKKVNTDITRQLSRYKVIRQLNQNRKDPLIIIQNGIVGLNKKLTVKKVGNGFDFKIF